jgi:hypothetical protein
MKIIKKYKIKGMEKLPKNISSLSFLVGRIVLQYEDL